MDALHEFERFLELEAEQMALDALERLTETRPQQGPLVARKRSETP